MQERLQKLLARAGVASRRKVEEMIREGRVTVNGEVAEVGTKADLDADAVKVDDKRILPLRGPCTYLLLNKPAGYLSTRSDPEGRRTVVDLIPAGLRRALVPVGRLDFDTEGLLLLTSDGEFAQRVAHPRYGCAKTYEAKVKGEPDARGLDKLRAGMVLDGHKTEPAEVTPFRGPDGPRDTKTNSWFRVVIGEGRTRQIREMFFRIGHPVQRLRRVGIGLLHDSKLPVGQWRHLTDDEVERLRASTKGGRGSVEQVKKRALARRDARDGDSREAATKAGPAPGSKPRAKRGPTGAKRAPARGPEKGPGGRAAGGTRNTRGAKKSGPKGRGGRGGGRRP